MPSPLVGDVPEVTLALEAAIFRCFSRRIADRTPNVAALAGDLLEAIDAPNADSVCARLAAILHARHDSGRRPAALGEDAENRSMRTRPPPSGPARAHPRQKKASKLIPVLALGAVLFGVALWAMHRGAEPPAPEATLPNPVSSIHVAVRATPPEATIEVDGVGRGSGSAAFDVTQDDKDHVVRIGAPGYVTAERTVRFSKDVALDEKLDTMVATASAGVGTAPSRNAPAHVAAAVAHPKASAAASTAAESPCSPPYYFSNGIKSFKPECL
jgi:hypothetical protein